MKLTKKIFNILFVPIFAVTCFNFTEIINAKIPEYKGLYTLFSPAADTIGIGQSLYYSRWIENKSAYAPAKGDLAKEVIDVFWFKRTENDNFLLTKKSPGSDITPEILGALLKYIIEFKESVKNKAEKEKIIELWFKACSDNYKNKILNAEQELADLPKKIKELGEAKVKLEKEKLEAKIKDERKVKTEEIRVISQNLKKKADKLRDMPAAVKKLQDNQVAVNKQFNEKIRATIEALEKLRIIDNMFIQETAAAILWAVFESNLDWADKEFEVCLNQINPTLFGKLKDKYNKADYEELDKNFEQEKNIENAAENIKDNEKYEKLTYYLIKTAKTKNVSNKVQQVTIIFKDPLTGKETKRFSTCFESAILDLISILIYNRETKKYDLSMLPDEVTSGEFFKALVDKVFREKNEFIDSEDVNKNLQFWIDLVTNLKELEYSKNINEIRYDLRTSLENLVKILNKFLNLGFEIIDTKDYLKIKDKKGSTFVVRKSEFDSWQVFFDKISKKLSTAQRIVRFELGQEEIENVRFGKMSLDSHSFCMGGLKISIGKTNMSMILGEKHAENICIERDQSNLMEKNLINLKDKLIDKVNEDKRLVPLFIFLPYMQGIDLIKLNTQAEELLYYSFNLKDPNVKVDFLKHFIFSELPGSVLRKHLCDNVSINGLVSSLIHELPNNSIGLTMDLVFYLARYKDGENKLCWQDEIEAKFDNVIKEAKEQNSEDFLADIFDLMLREKLSKFLSIKILQKIIDEAPNAKKDDRDKEPLLHIALRCNKLEIFKKLASNPEININAIDSKDNTALHFAVGKDKIEYIKILLAHPNININAKNKMGKIPLDYARSENVKKMF